MLGRPAVFRPGGTRRTFARPMLAAEVRTTSRPLAYIAIVRASVYGIRSSSFAEPHLANRIDAAHLQPFAPKHPRKITMRLEHRHANAPPRKQIPQRHPRRPRPNNNRAPSLIRHNQHLRPKTVTDPRHFPQSPRSNLPV